MNAIARHSILRHWGGGDQGWDAMGERRNPVPGMDVLIYNTLQRKPTSRAVLWLELKTSIAPYAKL